MDERTRVLVAALLAALIVVPAAARAATLTPTTTSDQFDLVADGECSLREAVESANGNADFGGCVAAGVYGDDTIVLAAGTYVLELGPPEDPLGLDNSVGDLDVVPGDVESLDVTGAGSGATTVERSDAAGDFRIFDLDVPGLLRLADLTVRNGVSERGGGIFSTGFSLVLERVVVRDNVAEGFEAQGGGISAIGEVISLTDTLVTANRADGTNDDPDCEDLVGGGGVFLTSCPPPGMVPTVAIRNALAGKAEIPDTGLLLIERTTISNNVTTSASDACSAGAGGAAIFDPSSFLAPETMVSRVVNSTVSGNSAQIGGGMIVVAESPAFLCGDIIIEAGGGRRGSDPGASRGTTWREVPR